MLVLLASQNFNLYAFEVVLISTFLVYIPRSSGYCNLVHFGQILWLHCHHPLVPLNSTLFFHYQYLKNTNLKCLSLYAAIAMKKTHTIVINGFRVELDAISKSA